MLKERSVAGNYLQLTDSPARLGLLLLLGNRSYDDSRKLGLDITVTSTTCIIVVSS